MFRPSARLHQARGRGPKLASAAGTAAALLTGLALLASAPAALALPARAHAATSRCGDQTVQLGHGSEGEAHAIRATRISCRRARTVARACVTNTLTGWKIFTLPQTPEMDDQGRTMLKRGDAVITFQVVGGGGCAD